MTKQCPFSENSFILRYFMVKLHQKCHFQDFGCCPIILDCTLYPQYKNALPCQKALSSQKLIYIYIYIFHLENNHYWKLGKFTKFLGHNHKSFRKDLTLDLLGAKISKSLTKSIQRFYMPSKSVMKWSFSLKVRRSQSFSWI